MMDDRSPRIHLTLTVWTLVLIGLVLVEARRLPPGLTALLVPYLVLMAWHWMSRLRRAGLWRAGDLARRCRRISLGRRVGRMCRFPRIWRRPGSNKPHQPASPRPPAEQASPRSRRGRARRRVRAHEPEPLAASWVQVRPGRFVRFEEISPEHPVDESAAAAGSSASRGSATR